MTETDRRFWIVPLTGMGLIRISGGDRRKFLQGQLTQDIQRLSPGRSIFAGWASPKGRLLMICQLFDWQEAVWMLLPAELRESIVGRLQMYVLRADVQLEISDLGVLGAGGSDLDAGLQTGGVSLEPGQSTCFATDRLLAGRLAGDSDRAVLLATAKDLPTAFSGDAAAQASPDQWRRLNISRGIPSVWSETSELFLPQMVNLDLCDGVSFEKGCYTGQEIVARTLNLGRIKRRMFRYRGDGTNLPQPGQSVFAKERSIGHVVEAVPDDRGFQMLAAVPLDQLENPMSMDETGRQILERLKLPYNVPDAPR